MPLGDTPFEMNHWQKWFAAGLFGFLSCASSLAEQPGTPFVMMSWELPPRAPGFDDPRTGLASLVDCGFNVAAFVQASQVPQCKDLGLKAMIRIDPWRLDWRQLSDEQIDKHVAQLIQNTSNDPTVLGYFLEDEPGTGDFPGLAKAVAAIKRLAPGKIAYINLFPDYATLGAPDLSQLGADSYEQYLEQYVSEVHPQFISYDNYRIEYSQDLQKPEIAASYFQNLLQVRQIAMKHALPFWNIVSSNQIRRGASPPSPANLLLQAYTTLAAGAKGITWYTYYSGSYAYSPIDGAGHKSATWSYLKMVNDQVRTLTPVMADLTSTGVYFTSAFAGQSLPALPGQLVKKVDSQTPVMVGEFRAANGDAYAMIVNISLERSAKVQLELATGLNISGQISPADGNLLSIDQDNSLWLPAGQGALLKISPK